MSALIRSNHDGLAGCVADLDVKYVIYLKFVQQIRLSLSSATSIRHIRNGRYDRLRRDARASQVGRPTNDRRY